MAEESGSPEVKHLKKRKSRSKNGGKARKKARRFENVKKVKINVKMKKILMKKARDYNSDEEKVENNTAEDDAGTAIVEGSENEEDGEIYPGITKFTQGCHAFKLAFSSIMNKGISDNSLGPVLSGHKKLIADKLSEELAARKANHEVKREKQLVKEKGHVKPAAGFLDSHERFLISIATKGVVRLFNAVSKAQKGSNPSDLKSRKAFKNKRKSFFSELPKASISNTTKDQAKEAVQENRDRPTWAPMCDNYMLTSSKLKDWDKMPEAVEEDEVGMAQATSDSDSD